MKIAIAADHAGFELKQVLAAHVRGLGHDVVDLGTDSPQSVDYPDFGAACGRAVAEGRADRGIVVCGTGIGISMAAGKIPGVRAAACHDHFTAAMARRHNDANVVGVGSRVIGVGVAKDLVETFLSSAFEGGRHAGRVQKLDALEPARRETSTTGGSP